MSQDCASFEQFAADRGNQAAEDLLTLVCDAHWNDGSEHVVFSHIESHDQCNHTLTGTVLFEGKAYDFTIENGNANGTVVHSFESTDDIPSQLFTGLLKSAPPVPANAAWCW